MRVLLGIGGASILFATACGPKANNNGSGTEGETESTDSSGTDETEGNGPDPYGDQTFGSGDRLRAMYLQAPGGGRQLVAFYDTELELACRFYDAHPSGLRCLPTLANDTGLPAHTFLGLLYADADCTVAAIETDALTRPDGSALTTGDLVTVTVDLPCGAAPPVATAMRVGEPASDLYAETSSGCVSVNPPGTTFVLESVNPTIFEQASFEDAHGIRRLVTDDGAWQNLFTLDDEGRGCAPIGETPNCVPLPYAWTDDYSNCYITEGPACEGPTGILPIPGIPSWCEIGPAYAFEGSLEPVFENLVTAGPPATSLLCEDDSGCFDAIETPTPYRIFTPGEPVALRDLPALTPWYEGEPPLVASHMVRPGIAGPVPNTPSVYWTGQPWWDTRYDTDCEVEKIENDLICVPTTTYIRTRIFHYGDASCSLPVFGSSAQPPFLLLSASALPDGVESDEPLAFEAIPHPGPVYNYTVDGTCELEQDDRDFFQAGQQLDRDALLSRLTLHTE